MSKSAFSDAHQILIEQLTAARKQSWLKQEELAALIGKDQSYISNIERGQRCVDVLEFIVLARAMNADPVLLFSEFATKLPKKFLISGCQRKHRAMRQTQKVPPARWIAPG